MLLVLTLPIPMEARLAVFTWAPRLKVAPPPVTPKVLAAPTVLAGAFRVKLACRLAVTTFTFRPSDCTALPLTVRVALRP